MASKNTINKNEWRVWYDDLASKIEGLSIKVSTSEIRNSPVPDDQHGDWSDVKVDRDRLAADVDLLKKEVTKLRETNDKLGKDMRSLQQDMVVVQSENATLRRDLDSLQTENTKLQAGLTIQQRDADKLRQAMNTAQRDVALLQSESTTLRRDLDSSLTENVKPRSSATTQRDVDDVEKLRREMRSIQTENQALRCDVTAVQKSASKADKESKQEIRKLSIRIGNMDTQIGQYNIQVAFHAELGDFVTLTGPRTVICDDVFINVGGGYNSQTGIFTAPVSGIYCFMATSSPLSDDVNEWCSMCIKMESKEIGGLGASWKGTSTGHTAIQVKAGHKVWLVASAQADHVNKFCNGTTFTGMLIQCDP